MARRFAFLCMPFAVFFEDPGRGLRRWQVRRNLHVSEELLDFVIKKRTSRALSLVLACLRIAGTAFVAAPPYRAKPTYIYVLC